MLLNLVAKIKFYTLLYIIIWLLMAILLWLYMIPVWFDFILTVSCSWRNHIILLLLFVAEKVLLILVISLTVQWKPTKIHALVLKSSVVNAACQMAIAFSRLQCVKSEKWQCLRLLKGSKTYGLIAAVLRIVQDDLAKVTCLQYWGKFECIFNSVSVRRNQC